MLKLLNLDEAPSAADLQPFWSSAFDQFQDAVLLIDKNAQIQSSNTVWQHLVQKQGNQKLSEQYQTQSFKEWLYQDDIIKFQRVLMRQKPQRLVLRLLVPEQPLIWLSLNLQPLFQILRKTSSSDGASLLLNRPYRFRSKSGLMPRSAV